MREVDEMTKNITFYLYLILECSTRFSNNSYKMSYIIRDIRPSKQKINPLETSDCDAIALMEISHHHNPHIRKVIVHQLAMCMNLHTRIYCYELKNLCMLR